MQTKNILLKKEKINISCENNEQNLPRKTN